jgi:hypothetical protein
LLRKVELTDGGRSATRLLKVVTAFAAAMHWPELTAEATVASWLFRFEASDDDSSPEPLPQAARSETAKPSPPATSARGAWRIRGVTLDTRAVSFPLGAP